MERKAGQPSWTKRPTPFRPHSSPSGQNLEPGLSGQGLSSLAQPRAWGPQGSPLLGPALEGGMAKSMGAEGAEHGALLDTAWTESREAGISQWYQLGV